MSTRLSLYLSKAILIRILAATIVLLLLGLSIDLIKSATELLEENGTRALASYAGLRSVQIIATLLPTGILIGTVLGFLSLSTHSEVVVIRATGLSAFAIVRMLLPLALMLGLAYHMVGDRPSAWAEARLAEIVPKTTNAPKIGAELWNRSRSTEGDEVLKAELAERDGTKLSNLSLWYITQERKIERWFTAERAEYQNGQWVLFRIVDRASGERIERDDWRTILTPRTVRSLAGRNAVVSAAEARSALAGLALQTRSNAYYNTRIARSYAAFVVPLVMIILAAPAALGLARSGSGLKFATLAVAVGLVFVAVDGILLSFGEIGAIAPIWAASLPLVLFTLVGCWTLFLLEN